MRRINVSLIIHIEKKLATNRGNALFAWYLMRLNWKLLKLCKTQLVNDYVYTQNIQTKNMKIHHKTILHRIKLIFAINLLTSFQFNILILRCCCYEKVRHVSQYCSISSEKKIFFDDPNIQLWNIYINKYNKYKQRWNCVVITLWFCFQNCDRELP